MSDDKTRVLTAEEAARWANRPDASDDKTRLLSAAEAAAMLAGAEAAPRAEAGVTPADREPRFSGSKITFFCANGHKIVVDRSLAGKKGTCSKQGCGVAVVIPSPPASEPAAEAGAAAVLEPGSPFGPAADAAPAAGEDRTGDPGLDLGQPDQPGATAAPLEWDFAAATPAGDPAAAAIDLGTESPDAAVGWSPDYGEIENPTARLVARLWIERAHGGVVEVHLAGGGVIMPEWYDPRWSCGTHALFAAEAADGTLTLTAVAWDQVQSVVVRKVQGTPDGMFEG